MAMNKSEHHGCDHISAGMNHMNLSLRG